MYSSIYSKVIFPALEKVQGTSVKKNLKFLKESQWWAPEKITELQDRKTRELVRHSYDNVPYYRRLFDSNNIRPEDIKTAEDLEVVPILTKDDIRKNLPYMLARNVPKSRMYSCKSSGSTGEPIKYFLHKEAYSAGWAQAFRCWSWVGYDIGDPYVKISLLPRNKFYKKVQDRLMNCFYIHSSEINEKTLDSFAYRIKRFNPKLIRGYTAHMYVFAKYLQDSPDTDLKINAIMTTGSTLYSHYRKAIESAFGCAVHDCYGGESTTVGFECNEHNGYHLCSENVVTEFVKGDRPAGNGEMSEVVFTNLDNYAMPFIRYKINDIAVPTRARCTCGRSMPLMSSVEGRDSDIVVAPNGNFLVVEYFAATMRNVEGIDQFQVLQDDINDLTVKIIKNDRFDDSSGSRHIVEEIRKEAGKDMKVAVEFVDHIPTSGSGKRRFVISKVPIESVWK